MDEVRSWLPSIVGSAEKQAAAMAEAALALTAMVLSPPLPSTQVAALTESSVFSILFGPLAAAPRIRLRR